MKLRNLFIVLLAVFMVIAFASCNPEPKDKPTPEPGPEIPSTVYQIQVTEGVDKDYWNRDKIKLQWVEEVKEGDVISLKYRSERDIYQWDIRDDSLKWVYETKKGSFTDPVLGDDGWYTLTYTFAKDINGADVDYPNDQFSVFFRGNFVTTDIFEIKEITLNGKPLAVAQENIISKAELTDPKIDFDWSVKNYTVLFALGTPGEVDKTPIAEKVVAGGLVTGAPIAREGYTLTIYTDSSRTQVFDPNTPINEEKIFYYQYIGVPRTVTLDLKGGSFPENVEASATIANGSPFVAPAEPTKEGVAFKAWFTDPDCTTPWVMTDAVTGDMTLYAGYAERRTVTFELNGGTFGEDVANTKIVADGNAVARPETDPTNGSKMFLGWYADEELTTAYDFSAPVTADVKVYAAWVNSTDVTLYVDGQKLSTFKTALDVALSADDENLAVEDDKIGFVFDGWYDEAACETPHDFTAEVKAPVTLYGKWVEAKLYQLISSKARVDYDTDKFTIQYKGEGAQLANAGDILSFRYRSTTAFTKFSIRGDKKWVYENSSATRGMTTYETKEDGWTYVTYVFAARTYDDTADIPANAWWRFDFCSDTIRKGDVLEIQDWAFNGEPLEIEDGMVTQYVAPTLSIVEGGAYEWGDQTVSFVMGENATAIADQAIKFGATIDAPEVTAAEGYSFAGWYADAEFTKEFDFALPIIKKTTIYAKLGESRTVTFNVNGGSEIAPVTIAKGEAVEQPANPAKAENVFDGWYADELLSEAYDFTTPVTGSITLYAKWIPSWTVTLNMNYGETPETKAVYVAKGGVMATPKNPTRVGYYFGGWYNDAECTTAHDFEAAVEANATIYAKWTEPTEAYLFTATVAEERFQFRWHEESGFFANGQIKPGDVFTLMIKFPEGNTAAESKWRLRTRSTEAHITEDVQFSSTPKEDGWYLITAVVPEGISGNGLYLQVYETANAKKGDKMIIKAFAYNGTAIEVDARPYGTASTSKGAYSKVKADGEVVNPDGTPKAE